MAKSKLRICALYPDLLNIYADRGNLMMLEKRCTWRDIRVEITEVGIGERIDANAYDLYYMGGGQDRDQILCAEDLVSTKRDAIVAATEEGAVLVAVCGGYQLLGHSYALNDRILSGLSLVDVETNLGSGPRLIGNVAIALDLPPLPGWDTYGDGQAVLAGFENHGGRTTLGVTERALGTVIHGFGNNGRDCGEGVIAGPKQNIIGTYLHGPLLPKNAWFADWLIAKALDCEITDLKQLDDRVELAAHRKAFASAQQPNRLSRSRLRRGLSRLAR